VTEKEIFCEKTKDIRRRTDNSDVSGRRKVKGFEGVKENLCQ